MYPHVRVLGLSSIFKKLYLNKNPKEQPMNGNVSLNLNLNQKKKEKKCKVIAFLLLLQVQYFAVTTEYTLFCSHKILTRRNRVYNRMNRIRFCGFARLPGRRQVGMCLFNEFSKIHREFRSSIFVNSSSVKGEISPFCRTVREIFENKMNSFEKYFCDSFMLGQFINTICWENRDSFYIQLVYLEMD